MSETPIIPDGQWQELFFINVGDVDSDGYLDLITQDVRSYPFPPLFTRLTQNQL